MAEYKHICVVCGKEYTNKSNNPACKYCSVECAKQGQRLRIQEMREDAELRNPNINDDELLFAISHKDKLNDAILHIDYILSVIGLENQHISIANAKNIIQRAISKLADISDDNNADIYSAEVLNFFNKFVEKSLFEIIERIYYTKERKKGYYYYFNAEIESVFDYGAKYSDYEEGAFGIKYQIANDRYRDGVECYAPNFSVLYNYGVGGYCVCNDCPYNKEVKSDCKTKTTRICLPKQLVGAKPHWIYLNSVKYALSKVSLTDTQARDILNHCPHRKEIIDTSRQYVAISLLLQRAFSKVVLDKYTKKSLYELYIHLKKRVSNIPSGMFAKVSDICKLQIQKEFVANNEKLFVVQKDFAEKHSYLFEYKPNF